MINVRDKHIPELDGIRGVACLGIIVAHCFLGIMSFPGGSPGQILTVFLLGGVDLFFVLSGFLIGGILIDNRNAANFFSAFWTRRIGRIFPALYVLVASYVAILIVRRNFDLPFLDAWLLQAPVHSPLWYATFTQSVPFVMTDWGPRWMGVTWSLAIEEQFYVIFPFLVYFLSHRSLIVTVVSAAIFAPICRILVDYNFGHVASYVLLPCRMDALLLGVLAAMVIRSPVALERARNYRFLIDFVIICLAIWIAFPGPLGTWLNSQGKFLSSLDSNIHYTKQALLFALAILRIFLYPRGWYHTILTWKPLTGLGLVSYGLYLYHQAVNGLVHGLLFGKEPQVDSLEQAAAAFLVMGTAILLATLSYFYFEMPIRRLAQRVKFRSPDAIGYCEAEQKSRVPV